MRKFEIILVSISLLAIALNFLLIPYANIVLILSLTLLAIFYLFFGFVLFLKKMLGKKNQESKSPIRIVGIMGMSVFLSISILGILFKIMLWPGSNSQLIMGTMGLMLVFILATAKYVSVKSRFYKDVLMRVVLFGGLGVVLFFTPNEILIKTKYRNHPEYSEALIRSLKYPENQEYRKRVREEREKMGND